MVRHGIPECIQLGTSDLMTDFEVWVQLLHHDFNEESDTPRKAYRNVLNQLRLGDIGEKALHASWMI